jgi:hypothetical protein
MRRNRHQKVAETLGDDDLRLERFADMGKMFGGSRRGLIYDGGGLVLSSNLGLDQTKIQTIAE